MFSVKLLREYVGKLEMPFETVHFVHIVDVIHVITQLVEELLESDSLATPGNINNNTLYISLLGDKGGTSTKLLLQVLNTFSIIHSNREAKMIGMYEGDKESALMPYVLV